MEETAASSFLDRFWNGVLPINPAALAQAAGLRVLPLSWDDSVAGLSGALHWHQEPNDPQPVLHCRFNSTESVERQRFTIAHEVGHYALGHIKNQETLFRDTNEVFTGRVYDPVEVQANRFAAALLMPAKLVQQAINNDGLRTVPALAARFGVSVSAMRWRLVNLGFLSSL